ncbi:MAG: glutamate 5-kinase [Clostridiaceae bacterium]
MKKRLIVVKVGTSSLTNEDGSISSSKIENLTNQLCKLKNEGHSIILVSSGAIAAGFGRLGFAKRPANIADKQAAASVGQGLLMEEYAKCFLKSGITCAQILLTQDDFADRRRYKNVFSAISVLLSRGAVPILNENDTVSIDELRINDNDTLSAQVAAMMHSHLLIILTDIDGLYTSNPNKDKRAKHISVVEEITDELMESAGTAGSSNATGGMQTKIKSAALATSAGVPVFICSSKEDDNIIKAVNGSAKGTYFKAKEIGMGTRRQWMAFYAQSMGNIYIDTGAAEAIIKKNKSLLPRGIVALEGDFNSGDVVSVYLQGSHECVGKGKINYSKEELSKLMKNKNNQTEAINRDNWVSAL